MQQVKVKKSELLPYLESNRRDHRSRFELAMEGFRVDAIARLDELIQRVLSNDINGPYLSTRIDVPQDHTKDYDVAIAMLQMSAEDEVTITNEEFRAYINDEWGWKESWVQSNALYETKGHAVRASRRDANT